MYPTVVILLVETQRLMTDICEINTSNAAAFEAHLATSGHLSSATGPVRTTMNNAADSQHPRALQSHGGRELGLEDILREVKDSQV